MPTCVTNVGQSGSDHTGTDGLNWFSAIGPDLSGVPLWSEHAETTLFPLINPTRDFMYNDTIGITIRLAVQTVSY